MLSTALPQSFAVTMISCDAHMEFPDTAMQTADILCTDGQIVRYDEMVSKGKTLLVWFSTLIRMERQKVLAMPYISGILSRQP